MGDSETKFVVFVNNIQVRSNEVCYKVSLCEKFSGKVVKSFPYLTVHMFPVNVTLEPNIYPQSDPPIQQKPIASAARAIERCSIITGRKSTVSFHESHTLP